MEKSILAALVASLVVVFFPHPLTAAEEFKLTIIRQKQMNAATLGELGINDSSVCYTLEPAPGSGKGPIPLGSYAGHLRYDKTDQWRIELDNVPGFQGVQIHMGNYPKDTSGCILVGMGRDDVKGELSKSAEAYKKLKKTFYGTEEPNSTPDKEIKVVISEP